MAINITIWNIIKNTNLKFVVFIILLFISTCIFGQKVKLSGYVVCEGSRDRISKANVIDIYSEKGTSSNNYGYYELHFNSGDSVLLNVTHVSYSEVLLPLKITKNTHLDVVMKQGHLLPEISIVERTPIEKRLEISEMRLSGEQVKLVPAITGEADIMRAFQMLPGVSTTNEAQSGMTVRGGDLGQNLYILDGTPLYSVNHIGGLLSTFDADAIQSADLIKGGFPANYGGRLSSVMDVETKNVEDMLRGNLTIGMLNCKLSLAGPLKNNKTSMLFSIRRFMYDIIMYPGSSLFLDEQQVGFTFYDINFKINHKFDEKNTLTFSTYVGDDIFKLGNDMYGQQSISTYRQTYGNKMASLRWKHKFNSRLNSKINISFTNYHSRTSARMTDKEDREYVQGMKFKNTVNILDTRATAELTYSLWEKSVLRAGIAEAFYSYSPFKLRQYSSINDSTVYTNNQIAPAIYGNEIAAFALGELYFGKYFSTNIGFRFTNYYDIQGRKAYWQPEPRILLVFNIPKVFAIKASYTHIYQNVQCVNAFVTGIPTDRWFISTGKIEPAKSEQFDLGISRSFMNGMYELSLDAYYKKMTNLTIMSQKISIDAMAANISDLNIILTSGKGKSKGIELLFTKTRGTLTGFVGYCLSQNLRQFDGINGNEYFVADNDRTHTFNISGNWHVSDIFSLSASWQFATGAPISVPNGIFYNTDGNYSYIYDGINNYRMKSFHRLDIGFNFVKSLRWGERTLTLSIINAYFRANPYFYHVGGGKMYQRSIFPFMPFLNYSVNFNKVSLIERGLPYLESMKEHYDIFRRHSIGFQLSPYLGDIKYSKPLVFAGRYMFGIFNYLSVGAEFSDYKETVKINTSDTKTSFDTRYGAICRATLPYLKHLHPFVEVSAYYGHFTQTFTGTAHSDKKDDYFSFYAAPGLSINMFKKYLSLDLMYKFSPRKMIDNKKMVFSWRVNVNF